MFKKIETNKGMIILDNGEKVEILSTLVDDKEVVNICRLNDGRFAVFTNKYAESPYMIMKFSKEIILEMSKFCEEKN